ncbi:MAG: dTDP-4-dehydrorhamnose reductase [Proteobacteria bacterium]|nr:dTDP-4-dehydrorhamnose reductase [Pseudomonadota bacterium]
MSGLLGHALTRVFPGAFSFWFDVTDLGACRAALGSIRPEVVINAAAYTTVDQAEAEPEAAHAVNEQGAKNLALACRDIGAGLVHLSTDYVFDGLADRPYLESDPPRPLSVYGQSKLAGERAVRKILPKALIVRASWLFGPGKTNFVKKMLDRARAGEPLRVVNDQRGCPTFSLDLAAAIRSLIQGGHQGLFHVAGSGEATWFDLTRAALEAAGLDPARVEPIKATGLDLPARRPAYSVLDCRRYEAATGRTMPPWPESLAAYVRGLV